MNESVISRFLWGFLWGVLWFCDVFAEVPEFRVIERSELVGVMREVSKGYDPGATTNGARFQAEVMLALEKRQAEAVAMLITPEDWYRAFLEVTDCTEENAPQYVQLAYEYEQFMFVDPIYKRVVRQVEEGPKPERAFNVMIWWARQSGRAQKYSYSDTLATPNLNVTNHQVITYRLLDFGDCFFFDEIDGVTGRPTTGVLGLLFKLIGEGRVVFSGMAISEDGLQITHGTAKKAFMGVTTTVTVFPDGKTEKDVLAGRADLRVLEALLKRPFEIDYLPWEWSAEMDVVIAQVVEN